MAPVTIVDARVRRTHVSGGGLDRDRPGSRCPMSRLMVGGWAETRGAPARRRGDGRSGQSWTCAECSSTCTRWSCSPFLVPAAGNDLHRVQVGRLVLLGGDGTA